MVAGLVVDVCGLVVVCETGHCGQLVVVDGVSRAADVPLSGRPVPRRRGGQQLPTSVIDAAEPTTENATQRRAKAMPRHAVEEQVGTERHVEENVTDGFRHLQRQRTISHRVCLSVCLSVTAALIVRLEYRHKRQLIHRISNTLLCHRNTTVRCILCILLTRFSAVFPK